MTLPSSWASLFIYLCRTVKAVIANFYFAIMWPKMPPDAGHGKSAPAFVTIFGFPYFSCLQTGLLAISTPGTMADKPVFRQCPQDCFRWHPAKQKIGNGLSFILPGRATYPSATPICFFNLFSSIHRARVVVSSRWMRVSMASFWRLAKVYPSVSTLMKRSVRAMLSSNFFRQAKSTIWDVRYLVQFLRFQQLLLDTDTDNHVRTHSLRHICRIIVLQSPVHQYHTVFPYRSKYTGDGHACPHGRRQDTFMENDFLTVDNICGNTGKRYGEAVEPQGVMILYREK